MTRPIQATIEFKLVLKNYQWKKIQTSFIFNFSFSWSVFGDCRARFPLQWRKIILTKRMLLLGMNVQFLAALRMKITLWIRPQVLRCLDTLFTCIFLPHSRHAIRWFLFIPLSNEKFFRWSFFPKSTRFEYSGIFSNFDIKQSVSSPNYNRVFIHINMNQLKSSFTNNRILKHFDIKQSELVIPSLQSFDHFQF